MIQIGWLVRLKEHKKTSRYIVNVTSVIYSQLNGVSEWQASVLSGFNAVVSPTQVGLGTLLDLMPWQWWQGPHAVNSVPLTMSVDSSWADMPQKLISWLPHSLRECCLAISFWVSLLVVFLVDGHEAVCKDDDSCSYVKYDQSMTVCASVITDDILLYGKFVQYVPIPSVIFPGYTTDFPQNWHFKNFQLLLMFLIYSLCLRVVQFNWLDQTMIHQYFCWLADVLCLPDFMCAMLTSKKILIVYGESDSGKSWDFLVMKIRLSDYWKHSMKAPGVQYVLVEN